MNYDAISRLRGRIADYVGYLGGAPNEEVVRQGLRHGGRAAAAARELNIEIGKGLA